MRAIITLSIICGCTAGAFAQSDSAQAPKKKTTLTVGVSYLNNANYYGQKAEQNMPYISASASLKLKPGLYFTGTGIRLLNDSGNVVSASAAGIGWAFNLGKKLTADLSYSHTFYPANSAFLQASNPDNFSASVAYEYWMTTAVNADYMRGKDQYDIFTSVSTEKQINLGSFGPNDLITLTPNVDVTAGTQHFYQTYVAEKRLRDSLLAILLPGYPAPEPETTTVTNTSFDIISYNLRLPLAYNRAHMMIEAAYQLSVLGKKAQTGAGTANSFFSLSFYYQF
ncbi:hypothetical protein MKQ68_03255 [Chitinophaga horti]|uniref:Uncharacterized protein n=1 Tax=Chitinophaga horti TaxID=2920382 RepID=A0ABY6J3F1_9BACT|nr:hypothetical protein [Chitinophaga horti]UYQ94108.1 hypothetical protein MKQ68_03255 [Chitinophaga horti]